MCIEHSLLGGAILSLSTRRVGDCEEAIRPSDYTRHSIWIWPESTAHCREVGGRVAVVKMSTLVYVKTMFLITINSEFIRHYV